MRRLVLATIRLYQYAFSPYFGGHCRYEPTCSNYALEAVARYGATRGVWFALKRLTRCRPLGASGYDPAP